VKPATADVRPRRERASAGSQGYILLEAVVALAVLSVGVITVNNVMREALRTRAQARDFTQARFLLEGIIEDLQVRPVLKLGHETGRFKGELSRFRYRWEIGKVEVPAPEIPDEVVERVGRAYKPTVQYLGKITATVTWECAGQTFQRTAETLFPQGKLPPKERRDQDEEEQPQDEA